MSNHFIHSTLRFFFVVIIVIIAIVSFYNLIGILYPFIIAVLITMIINPIVSFFEKKCKLPRSISVFLSLFLFVSILVGIIAILVAEIVSSSSYIADVIPINIQVISTFFEGILYESLFPIYDKLLNLYENFDTSTRESILENIQTIGSSLTIYISNIFTTFLSGLTNLIASLPNFVTVFIFSSLATFFISKDWEKLKHYTVLLIPDNLIINFKNISSDLTKALSGYIKAQITLLSITFCIVLIGLLILRVPYAFTFATAIALVDILPYLGTGIVFIPWILYSFIIGNSKFGIALLILYLIVIIQRQLMEPKILSKSIGLDPLATLLALFIGFKLLGFFGLLIGPVILVFLKTLYKTGILTVIKCFILGKKI